MFNFKENILQERLSKKLNKLKDIINNYKSSKKIFDDEKSDDMYHKFEEEFFEKFINLLEKDENVFLLESINIENFSHVFSIEQKKINKELEKNDTDKKKNYKFHFISVLYFIKHLLLLDLKNFSKNNPIEEEKSNELKKKIDDLVNENLIFGLNEKLNLELQIRDEIKEILVSDELTIVFEKLIKLLQFNDKSNKQYSENNSKKILFFSDDIETLLDNMFKLNIYYSEQIIFYENLDNIVKGFIDTLKNKKLNKDNINLIENAKFILENIQLFIQYKFLIINKIKKILGLINYNTNVLYSENNIKDIIKHIQSILPDMRHFDYRSKIFHIWLFKIVFHIIFLNNEFIYVIENEEHINDNTFFKNDDEILNQEELEKKEKFEIKKQEISNKQLIYLKNLFKLCLNYKKNIQKSSLKDMNFISSLYFFINNNDKNNNTIKNMLNFTDKILIKYTNLETNSNFLDLQEINAANELFLNIYYSIRKFFIEFEDFMKFNIEISKLLKTEKELFYKLHKIETMIIEYNEKKL